MGLHAFGYRPRDVCLGLVSGLAHETHRSRIAFFGVAVIWLAWIFGLSLASGPRVLVFFRSSWVGHLELCLRGWVGHRSAREVFHFMMPNKPDAVNPAIASRFHAGRHWRGVTDPERWATQRASP